MAEVTRYCKEGTSFGVCLIFFGVSILSFPPCLERNCLISQASNSSFANWDKNTYIINTVLKHMIFTFSMFSDHQKNTAKKKKAVHTVDRKHEIFFKFHCWLGVSNSLPQSAIVRTVQGPRIDWRKLKKIKYVSFGGSLLFLYTPFLQHPFLILFLNHLWGILYTYSQSKWPGWGSGGRSTICLQRWSMWPRSVQSENQISLATVIGSSLIQVGPIIKIRRPV